MQALSLRPRATLTTSFPRIALRYFDGVNDAGCVWRGSATACRPRVRPQQEWKPRPSAF